MEEDADQWVDKPKSDTSIGVERAKERQMREHTEQTKTVTSAIAMRDENKNVTHEMMTLEEELERKDERQNTPNQKVQRKQAADVAVKPLHGNPLRKRDK